VFFLRLATCFGDGGFSPSLWVECKVNGWITRKYKHVAPREIIVSTEAVATVSTFKLSPCGWQWQDGGNVINGSGKMVAVAEWWW
jgi:hypothetical protein